MHGSGAIRTIIGEYNTKIADHEPAPRNARPRGPAMHNRGALAGRKNGWKRHAFGPGTTRLVFHGGGNRDLRHARPNLRHAIRKRLAPSSTARRMRRISAASFTIRARSTRGGAERRRAFPFSVEAKRSRVAAVIDSGSMPTTNGVDFRRRAASHSAARRLEICARRQFWCPEPPHAPAYDSGHR